MKIISIITTKNRPSLFKKAFLSVLKQTRVTDQIIVVSDSIDENFKIEKVIIGNKAKLIDDSFTHNYAGSLNSALSYIISESIFTEIDYDDTYIATLDDDDIWDKEYLSICERAIKQREDFVVTGIVYCSEKGEEKLSIPHVLSIDDFLKGNPHIQGSNTFIKFSALLKAGIFDENMSSTTDRDLFVRVMMLNPSYAVVDKYLVYVDAFNNRQRITNGTDKKADGLKKFFYKYSCLMNENVKEAFFKRAKELFLIDKNRITDISSNINSFNYEISPKKYDGNLIVGFIATDYILGLRLLNQLVNLKRNKTHIVILINFTNTIDEYIEVLKQTEYEYDLITHDMLIDKVQGFDEINISKDSLKNSIIKDISVARSLLQLFLYDFANKDDVVWILDEDMELYQLAASEGKTVKIALDIDNEIAKYKDRFDAVIGKYSLDAPLPSLSFIRCSLLDYAYHTFGLKGKNIPLLSYEDYYYDLSDQERLHLETPISYLSDVDIDVVFSGKTFSRPLFLIDNSIDEAKNRGGNTLIFNKELLNIPNWSIKIDGIIGRRGDYFWVLEARKKGHKIASVPFATLHNRRVLKFDIDKELEKFLRDLIGSSFTKAWEKQHGGKDEFFLSFKQYFISRLSIFISSYYRIIGLLSILKDEKYLGEFTYLKLNKFVRYSKEFTKQEKVISAYEELFSNLELYENNLCNKNIEMWLKNNFNIKSLRVLGKGKEANIYTDGEKVYKCFLKKPKKWDLLNKIAFKFNECNELYSINLLNEDNHYLITYEYNNSQPFIYENYHEIRGKIHEEIANLISFFKKIGVVFTNFKRENFVLIGDQVKLIDYGDSFETISEDSYNKMVIRAYEMLHYPTLSEDDFQTLIKLYYMGKTSAHDYGVKWFKYLINKRYKENIHDDLICNLIEKYNPRLILDYGAGKCRIANKLSQNFSLSVFDIDIETMVSHAFKDLTIYSAKEDIPKESFDMVISNLVLCCVDNNTASQIIENIAKALKNNGRAIISICNPFYNNVQHTELKTSGTPNSYYESQAYVKNINYGKVKRVEFHRPIEFYISLLKRHGFEIENIYETSGINADTLNPISEHIIFDCKYSPYIFLENTSLLIKTNPMEANYIYQNIRHIVSELECGICFSKRIVVVDSVILSTRTRRYDSDDLIKLQKELEKAKVNGLIDEIIYAPKDERIIKGINKKYFDLEFNSSHAKNGQGLFAALYGFDCVKTKYVFQTDSDILYHVANKDQILSSLEELDKGAITVSFSIPRLSFGKKHGCRCEVRSSFLNLSELKKNLPLFNKIENDTILFPWHRVLDNVLNDDQSIRFENNLTYFLHPENSIKKDMNFLSRIQYLIEKGIIPEKQYNNVNVIYNNSLWCPFLEKKVIIYIRGRNTPCEKLKRLFLSLQEQKNQNFYIVYVDDASDNSSEEYAKFIFEYDPYFKDKVFPIFNRKRVGELANLVYVMKNVIINPHSIVINIDSDDYLVDSNAIDIILNEFNRGAELTIGNCLRHDKPLKSYKVESFINVWERNGDNIWLHPKCFRRELFDVVDIETDLKIDGHFLEVNTDFAFMLPMVSNSKKSVFIDKVIYYFEPSIENQLSQGKYEDNYKNNIKNVLLNRYKNKISKND